MSLLDQVTPSPRKIMTLFYVVDTSGSMTGEQDRLRKLCYGRSNHRGFA